ncbi:MAG: arsenite methyltransferase [Anaerolineales bacterium]|nr:arsenite methyltransferase [Anaerolineales bacterium]
MSTPIETPELIHIEVREHYSERARNVGSSCCGSNGGSNCSDAITLYGAEELALLPDDMAGATWGCGNPTAIAALEPGSVVLDLGSGGGFDVVLAAKKVGSTGFVYGVDMTDDMLELARRNAANAGVTNVEFLKGQIEDIPLPEKTVDVIISNCVINLSPDKGQTLTEAYRVLRPGGKLAVSDIVVDGVLDDLPVSEAQIRAALSWAGCIAGALTVDQYRALLASAGFVDIQVDVQHRYAIEEFGEDAQMAAQGIPAEVAKELVRRFTSSNISAHRPV